MNRRLKLALAALLGFSAACSTVKNAPKQGEPQNQESDGPKTGGGERPRVKVMYGVPSPRPAVEKQIAPLEMDPTVEAPVSDSIRSYQGVPRTESDVDPVVEAPVSDSIRGYEGRPASGLEPVVEQETEE